PSLKQQHVCIRIGRKPRSHNRAGGACTANYEVIVRLQLERESLLIEPNSFPEVDGIGPGYFHKSVLLCILLLSNYFPVASRSRLACSTPTTGRFAGSSSPTCTSNEAWSHQTCSCATFPFSNFITTTCGSSTFFPVGGIPGSR